MRSTHTYAVLEVPPVVYAAVKALLQRAGSYEHAFLADGAKERIDMHGIALEAKTGGNGEGVIEMGTIISAKTGRARIEFQVGTELVQLDVDKAREIARGFTETIEAAISDELIMRFLQEKVNLPADKAAALLVDFRELRQGSKKAVNPS